MRRTLTCALALFVLLLSASCGGDDKAKYHSLSSEGSIKRINKDK